MVSFPGRLVSARRTGTERTIIATASPTSASRDGHAAVPATFAVLGAGRLGTLLAQALRDSGLTLLGYTTATPAGARRARARLGQDRTPLASLVTRRPALWLLTVPDDALVEVGTTLARAYEGDASRSDVARSMAGTVVAHTSGATPLSVLDPCRDRGATVLSWHPLQTVTEGTDPSVLAEARVAVSAPDEAGWLVGEALARLLHARPLPLPEEGKAVYHAAAVVASNYLVTLGFLAEELGRTAGLPPEESLAAFLPLMRRALANVEATGPVDALTGPLSRGDTDTVRRHLEALEAAPEHVTAAYRALGLSTLELVDRRGELAPGRTDTLRDLLGAPTRPGHTAPEGSSTGAAPLPDTALESATTQDSRRDR